MLKKFIKSFARKAFLTEAKFTPKIQELLSKVDKDFMSERSFYFGLKHLRVASLAMESAPGTSEMVLSILSSYPSGSTILDFGCGQHQSKYIKRMGFNVHSCDVLPFSLENYTKIDPLVNRLPFADGQFDIVIASEVLEHVESPWEILKELVRVSKKSVIITTPNPGSKKSRKQFFDRGFLYWFAPENFEYHISPIFWWQVELFCKRHNLKLGKIISNHDAFELNDGGEPVNFAEAFIYQISK